MARWLPLVAVLFLCACGGDPQGNPTATLPCDGQCPANQCFFGECSEQPADLGTTDLGDADPGGDLTEDLPDADTDATQDADLADQPDADQPDADQPDADQPDADQPDADQPDVDQPDADQPDAPDDLADLTDPDQGDADPGDLTDPDQGDLSPDADPGDLPEDQGDAPDDLADAPDDLADDMAEDQDLAEDLPDLAPGCVRDDQCGDGEVCEEGECFEGCRQDAECGPDEICLNNQCQAGCRQDAACPRGAVCEALACVTGCRQDRECPSGERCAQGQCAPRACALDRDCDPGSWCEDNQCAPGCRDDLECGDDQICPIETRTCETGCRQDQDCPQGSYCGLEGLCAPGCRADSDCEARQICGPSRECAPGCRDDEACAPTQYCDLEASACAPGCRLRGCPALQVCDLEARACVTPASMCFGDGDCGESQICEPFFCVGGCRDDEGCAQGQVCEPEALLCRAGCRGDDECLQGQHCDPAQRSCVEGCRDDASCGLGRACAEVDGERRCVLPACTRDADCPAERFCEEGACEPGCREGADCPQGQRCDLQIRVCVQGPCEGDEGCAAGEVCEEGACEAGCRADAGCPQGSYCDLELAPGQCVSGCRVGECPQGQRCDPFQRFCVTPQCQGDGGCPQGQYCRDEVICEPGCRGDGDCGQGEVCDPGLRRCAPGCRQRAEADDACPAPGGAVALPDNGAIDLQGQLCDGDVEHVAVALRPRERFIATLVPGAGVGAPQIELLDAACARPVALAGGEGDPNRIAYSPTAAGIYVIRLQNTPDTSSRAWGLNLRREPPPCPTDAEEPNEAPSGLTPRIAATRGVPAALRDRALCVGDEDWYALQVDVPGDAIQLTLRQAPDAAPLSLGLYNDQGALLTSAQAPGPSRTISTGSLARAGRFFVRVWGQQPVPFSGLGYDLEAVVGPDVSCVEDDLEPNDSLAEAPPVGEGDYALRLCQGRADQDWVRLDLIPGDRVHLALRYDHALTPGGQLPVTLYGPGGVTDPRDFAARDGDTDQDLLAFSPQGFEVSDQDAGPWWLHIDAGAGRAPIEIALDITIEAPQCDDPLELAPNERCAQASPLPLGDDAPGLLCGPTRDEDWFRVPVAPGRGLYARLEHLHFEGNLELEAWTIDQSTLLGFSYNAGPNLEEITLPDGISGEVCFRVFARDRQVTNTYQLNVTQD
jgi:hypothetical protein